MCCLTAERQVICGISDVDSNDATIVRGRHHCRPRASIKIKRMNAIEEKLAHDYVDRHMMELWGHNRARVIDNFVAGMECWAEIERDAAGYATDECLDEMLANVPFLIYDSRKGVVEMVSEDQDLVDWRGDIERGRNYTLWKPIILPRKE